MGAGASSQSELQMQTAQWDGLIDELESLCKQQRKVLETGFISNKSPKGDNSPRLAISSVNTSVDALPLEGSLGRQLPGTQPGSAGGERRRRSSILKKEGSIIEKKRQSAASGPPSEAGEMCRTRRSSSVVSFTGGREALAANADAVLSPTQRIGFHGSAAGDVSSPGITSATTPMSAALTDLVEVDGVLQFKPEQKRQARSEYLRIRKQRKEFFQSYLDTERNPNVTLKCSYIGLLCAGLSYLLAQKSGGELSSKNRVSVEDVFFTCQLPLHYIMNSSITLAELYDICKEFVDHDPRFRNTVRVEVFHMDTCLVEGEVEQGERSNESGDRGPPTMATFRKTLEEEMHGLNAIRIYNFDPFVVEQAKIHMDDSDSDDDEEVKELLTSVSSHAQGDGPTTPCRTIPAEPAAVYKPGNAPVSRFGRNNRGWFSLCTEFNSVQHSVTLMDAEVDSDVHLKQQDAPLAALYRACCSRDGFNGRNRGFIRLSLADHVAPLKVEEDTDSREMFVPDLYSGKGPYGIPLSSIDPAISSHLAAFAYALHLVEGLMPQDECGRGINVGAICKTMKFPISVMVQNNMPLLQVVAYYKAYLEAAGRSDITIQPQPIERKVDKDDAPPTMSIMDFEGCLLQVMEKNEDNSNPCMAMILCFHVGCAHNLLNIAPVDSSHYGIFMSYDQEKQLVKILDVFPKKYTRIWVSTLQRLHKALIGRGYVMVYRKDPEMTRANSEISIKRQDTLVKSKLSMLRLPPAQPDNFRFFVYPPKPMCITQLAVAMCKLGKTMLVKDFIHNLNCDPSFAILESLSLTDMERIFVNSINNLGEANSWGIDRKHIEVTSKGHTMDYEKFRSFLIDSAKEMNNYLVLCQCAKSILKEFGGGGGTEYVLVADVDSFSSTVLVVDANPSDYMRHISLPIDKLYEGMGCRDPASGRGRGYLVIRKDPLAPHLRFDFGRNINILNVPSPHPFKMPQAVHLNAIAFALTSMNHPCSPEDIFYKAYTCLGGERFRRGSAIFPWQQLKISLSELQERMTVTATAKMVQKFEVATRHDMAGETVTECSKSEFVDLCAEASDPDCPFVVMLIYDTFAIHNLIVDEEAEALWKIGCGLLKYFDPKTGMVYVADANPTRYGEIWSTHVDTLYEATDLDSADRGENGVVKVGFFSSGFTSKRSQNASGAVFGPAAF